MSLIFFNAMNGRNENDKSTDKKQKPYPRKGQKQLIN